MIIWLWIFISLILTLFFLRNKKIELYNLIWAFLPIEKYGIELMGVVIKPVFIFSLIIITYYVLSGRFKFRLPLYSYITTLLFPILIALTLFFRTTSAALGDIKLYALFFFSVVCAASSLSLVSKKDDFRQIRDVIFYTAVGYGLVFFILVNLYNLGFDIPGVWGKTVEGSSIMIELNSVLDGEFISNVRLRGFCNDANYSNIVFILGTVAGIEKWIKDGGGLKNIFPLILFFLNIFYTSSRSGFLIFAILVSICVVRFFFSSSFGKRKILLLSTILFITLFVIIFLVFNSDLVDSIYSSLIKNYSRSKLTGKLGRFTIWQKSIETVFSSTWYAGIGSKMVIFASTLYRDAHNTFVEVLCTSGLFVAIYYTFYFMYPAYLTAKHRIKRGSSASYGTYVVISYMMIILVNCTVSSIASAYML